MAIPIADTERVRFHHFDESHLRRMTASWGNIAIRKERPGLVEVEGCAVTPVSFRNRKVAGVYDKNNELVTFSARFRGKDNRLVDAVLDRDEFSQTTNDPRDTYYLGRGDTHFGHFILETLCRAWAWKEHGRDRVPVLQLPAPPFVEAFYSLFQDLSNSIAIIENPTRFRSMLVPAPSFVIAQHAHVEFKAMCEYMGERVSTGGAPVTEQPLYLSRAGLSWNHRTILGEEHLERFLESEGFLVVRPETRPIAEQIALINRHRWIVAPEGSACHVRLFSRNRNNFVTITPQFFNPNYVMCDLLSEGESHYVNALATPDMAKRARLRRFFEPVVFDQRRLLETLRQLALVRPCAAFNGPPPDFKEYKLRWIEAARAQIRLRPAEREKLLIDIENVTASLDAAQ